jgi:type IV pilus assembly protein PilX
MHARGASLYIARCRRRPQRGAVLVVGLIFLVILTLMGVTAMRTTNLEERMAGNTYDRHIAFQAAEAALREAERWLGSSLPNLHHGCAGGLCVNPREQDAGLKGWQKNPDHALWNAQARVAVADLPNVAAPPRYIIEDMCEFTPPGGLPGAQRVYRITAVGYGGTPEARVVLQSAFTAVNTYGTSPDCDCGDPSYCDGSCPQITCSP